MGQACIRSADTTVDEVATAVIDEEAREQQAAAEKVLKLLWLGPGESGKSTLFRRVKSKYGDAYTEDDRLGYRVPISNNVIIFMKTLVNYAQNSMDEDLKVEFDAETQEAAELIQGFKDGDTFNKSRALVVKTLWKHQAIKNAFTHRGRCHVPESSQYFFDKVEDLAAYDYIPSDEDCLRSRIRTLGLIETDFEAEGQQYKMIDVGGQKNERKKWIMCFEDVAAVLFVVAISEYDQMMFEDESTNRMDDSLQLYSELVNHASFRKATVCLFLNKKDLFKEKIQKVPLTECFPDYTGPQTYEAGIEHIKAQFKKLSDITKKTVYVHVTCGLDSSDVEQAVTKTLGIIATEHASQELA